jgi:membrane fusion protein, peptide pheromone/bacteriocin exporter
MQTQLFPPEVLENSVETYLPKVTARGKLLYLVILLMLVTIFILLPVIKVNVSVQSGGEVGTVYGRSEIHSQVSGILSEVKVKDNETVQKNQTLFIVTQQAIDTKLDINQTQKSEKQTFIADLEQLVKNFRTAHPSTSLYKQQLSSLRAMIGLKQPEINSALKNLKRARTLYAQKVFALVELEEKELAYNKLMVETNSLIQNQLSQWQSELSQYKATVGTLEVETQQIKQDKDLYTIKAPLTGSIQLTSNKAVGSYVQQGEQIAVLSPDSNLIADCYVTPGDIGLLKKDMPVRFRVDAFNYNEWGMIEGSIMDIADDFVMLQNQPMFKIRCKLNTTELQLKNGYKGKLKKGMSVQGVFIVARRSLMQLLYDNVDDWLNPTRNTNKQPAAKQ